VVDLSVVIVNYNVKYFLEQCLHSVVRAASGLEVEIFVVDNNSTDGSHEYLPQRFPSVIFNWQPDNTGFSKANNLALQQSKGDYILFLNPDTIVPEDCFHKAIGFMKAHPDAGAMGVRMLDGAGFFLRESKRSFPTARASFFKISGLSAMFPDSPYFSNYYAAHIAEETEHEVDVLAGAFMLLSKACAMAVKGFDEDYFLYGEDIDLSYRIKKAGFKNYYVPGIEILHFKGESTHRNSREYVRHFYNAMRLFVNKHYRRRRITRYLMSIAIRGGSALAFIKRRLDNLFRKEEGHGGSPCIAVVAGQKRFENMIHILKHAKTPFLIRGRIALNKFDIGIHLGELKDLSELIKRFDLDDLLFCEGPLCYSEIISVMREYRGEIDFLIHADGSSSIVGSRSKNRRGITIAEG